MTTCGRCPGRNQDIWDCGGCEQINREGEMATFSEILAQYETGKFIPAPDEEMTDLDDEEEE